MLQCEWRPQFHPLHHRLFSTKSDKRPFFSGWHPQYSGHPSSSIQSGEWLQDWFSYACPKFVAASMPDLDSCSATDRWGEDLKFAVKPPVNMTMLMGNLRFTLRFQTFLNHSIFGDAYFQANLNLRVDGKWPYVWEQFLSKDEHPQRVSLHSILFGCDPPMIGMESCVKHVSRHSEKR